MAAALGCPDATGDKQIFWGDLHVHSGYSLDAWGYGTATSPAQAYAFAKGDPIPLADGSVVSLPRPLDFMAVTDHAEWFNLMYICTEPMASTHPYCATLTEKNSPAEGAEVFRTYVLPTITRASPQPTPLCAAQPGQCQQAHLSQWQRVQDQANAANDPCNFTTFVGFEWSATPDFSHNHRNIIFANHNVTPQAIDYMRYPTPQKLWRELARQCRVENGCDVLAIPHNTNMGDGKSFDVETESPEELALRAHYERLVEIHQEKGNSECLPAFGASDEDCNFEIYLTKNSQPQTMDGYTQAEWERMRGTYVRGLLLRGLAAYQGSGEQKLNPLQLGIIGSTDNHAGTGGFTDEQLWPGTLFGFGDFERTMARQAFNPGGLVAVWAEENTRERIFAALKRREVFATSGPRIRVRLAATSTAVSCAEDLPDQAVPMGSVVGDVNSHHLRVQVQADHTPITAVEIVKGTLVEGQPREQVIRLWQDKDGVQDLCVNWTDEQFAADLPQFWYARVLQAPTPRWTAYRCQREGRCEEFPQAERWVRERAWTSPIWHLPGTAR